MRKAPDKMSNETRTTLLSELVVFFCVCVLSLHIHIYIVFFFLFHFLVRSFNSFPNVWSICLVFVIAYFTVPFVYKSLSTIIIIVDGV